jgi:hypothetical protein
MRNRTLILQREGINNRKRRRKRKTRRIKKRGLELIKVNR